MARGRFISNEIMGDKGVNDLSSDTCRLAYIYLITLADCEGRIIGDPDYLASMLFPRRREVTPEQIGGFIEEWALAGFVHWYETSDGEKIIQLINWDKHQKGLRKDREAPSNFPSPEECKLIQVKGNLREDKLREVKGSPPTFSGPSPDLLRSHGDNEAKEEDYITTFCQITGIAYPFNINTHAKWIQEVGEWVGLKVTRDDIQSAHHIAVDKGYTVARPASLTNFLRGEISRANAGKTDKRKFTDQDGNEVLL